MVSTHPGYLLAACLLAPLVVWLPSCIGEVGEVEPPSEIPAPPGELPAAPAPASLRRLTEAQFRQSLQYLLGDVSASDIEDDVWLSGFASVGASQIAVSRIGVEKFETAARQAVAEVFVDEARVSALLGCEPTAPSDAECAHEFIETFGRRAWRRSLTGEELTRHEGVLLRAASAADDFREGAAVALTGLLQSPYFLYRFELAEPDPDSDPASGRARFSSIEMASRLAFFVTGQTPDDELIAAGENGELLNIATLQSQAERLLAEASSEAGIRAFADELFELGRLATVGKDPSEFPELTDSLRAAMREEVSRLFAQSWATESDAMELFTSDESFANAELAAFYGVDVSSAGDDGFGRIRHPVAGPRSGLLGTGALLTLYGKQHETSPTLRGKFIQEVLLCREIPAPPDDVETVIPEPPAGVIQTRREQLDLHRSDASCAGCHSLMDPPGYALERFDAIGRVRDTDRGLPIDTTGQLGGVPFDGARGLGAALSQNADVRRCLVENLYRYATGHENRPSEDAYIRHANEEFAAAGNHLKSLMLAIVLSDGFRYAEEL